MAETTGIEWCDATFNPWIGCTKVSAACDSCYAETLMDHRFGRVEWGHGKPRKRTSESNWRKPLRWNDTLPIKLGRRPRVFCASLADVFDTEVDDSWRADLMLLIAATPNLDWLLLTKRPHVMLNWRGLLPANVWCGTTIEAVDVLYPRAKALAEIKMLDPDRITFWSCEPLLELLPIWVFADMMPDWLIVGGESGHAPRPLPPVPDLHALLHECRANDTAFFMKQMSGRTKAEREAIPEDLMVREFPA